MLKLIKWEIKLLETEVNVFEYFPKVDLSSKAKLHWVNSFKVFFSETITVIKNSSL